MIRRKKLTALIIAVLMLMSNCMGLLGNIALAIQTNVTVEFSVENNGSAHLSDDGKTLNYSCGDGSSYDIQLVQNGTALELTKYPDSTNGDKYIATGISSNEDVQVYSPYINLGVLGVFFGDLQISMVPEREEDGRGVDYYSTQLIGLATDSDHYNLRIQEVHQGEGNPQNQNNDMEDREFIVDFGNNSWTVNNKTTSASIEGIESLTNGPVHITGGTEITLANWDPNGMEAHISIVDSEGREFGTRLFVSDEGVTRIMDFDAANLPDGDVTFYVEERRPEQQSPEDMAETMYSVDFGEATWEVRGKTTVATIEGLDLTNGRVNIRGDEVITLSNWDPNLMQASIMVVDPAESEDRWFRDRLNVNENGETRIMDIRANNMPNPEGSYLEFYVERYQGELPEYDLEPANTSATVTVTGGPNCNASYLNARIAINGYGVWLDDPQQNPDLEEGGPIPEVTTLENFEYHYDEEGNGKVTIALGALFITKYVGTVSINGQAFTVADYIDYSNRTDWLDHYSGQMVGFEVEVDKADRYDIVVNLDEMEGHYIAIGNFLWTDDPAESETDLYIGNSTLEVLSVTYEYDGQEIYVEGQDLFEDPHIEYFPYAETASLVVPEGAMCTMRITPDYGYQVTSFGVNGNDIVTGDAISVFEFPIHKGNFHLNAEVTPVDDVVDPITDKVRAGTISIGNDEIDSGTVVLSVDDANPTDEKTQKFEEAAGDYTIDSYLDISLDQVFYKGTSEDVWANEIHTLNNDATIELELEDDLDDKNIIIIHNNTNGEEESYDIIEIDSYDPETNTVTFKTDSFSNYAIAVKDNPNNQEEEPEEPENPADPTDPENPTDPVDPENPSDPENPDEPGEPEEPEEPATAQKQYTVTEGDFTAIFSDDEGHDFELEIMELLHLTPEELAAMDLTEEQYEQAKAEVTEALKEYGTILNVYEIQIFDEDFQHFNELTLRFRMTEEMKKYNSFKFICIDHEELEDGDIVELEPVTIDGQSYLQGNLFHLSNYALVAKNVETQETTDNTGAATTDDTTTNTTTNTTEEKTNNPKTGDNIMLFVTMLVISVVGMRVSIKFKR